MATSASDFLQHLPADLAMEVLRRAREAYHAFRPLPKSEGQAKFIRRVMRGGFTVSWLLGGNRSGKSECGAWLAAHYAQTGIPRQIHAGELDLKGPPTLWVVAESYELAGEICWKQKLKRFLHPRNIADIAWHNKVREWPSLIRTKQGVEIVFKSWEQGRESFQGLGILGAWVDEQVPFDVLTEICARCVDYRAPVWLTLTPINPCADLDVAYSDPPDGWEFLSASIDDNRISRGGFLNDADVDKLIASWPPEVRETRRNGRLAGLEGAVFQTWSRETHVRDFTRADIPNTWRFVRGLDWGFRNPTCVLWAARDDEGRWWVYDEHYEAAQKIEHHLSIVVAKTGADPIATTWADYAGDVLPTGPDGYKASARAEFEKGGVYTSNAYKNRWNGIEAVRAALQLRPSLAGKPEPGLFVSRRQCPNLIREMSSYRVVPDNSELKNPGETPVSRDDHAVDALRYIIASEATSVQASEMATLLEFARRPSSHPVRTLYQRR